MKESNINFLPKKDLTIFDIDETLFHTQAKVQVIKNGKTIRVLDSKEQKLYSPKTGESLNYEQFKSSRFFKETSKPIPSVIKLAHEIIDLSFKNGSEVIIVTARQDMDDKKIFKEVFHAQGIDIDKVYVERAGNIGKKTASENKLVIFKRYLDSNKYSNINLIDDDINNLEVFISLRKLYPETRFSAFQVIESGNLINFN